jgi:hypothetical protein
MFAYGGGDPSITYLRVPSKGDLIFVQTGLVRLPYIFKNCDFKWLMVMGIRYLLVRKHVDYIPIGNFSILNEIDHKEVFDKLTIKRPYYSLGNRYIEHWVGAYTEAQLRLTRKVGIPVFTFNLVNDTVYVDPNVPILSDLNFHKFYSSEQMYQELAYFMGNTMKVSPDLSPPSKMTDKEKIMGHGFDIKQSFRHRK